MFEAIKQIIILASKSKKNLVGSNFIIINNYCPINNQRPNFSITGIYLSNNLNKLKT